jgi:PAS domain S-box-containing protein
MTPGAVFGHVSRLLCKDGSYRWIEWRALREGTLTHAAGRDITERKQAETAFAEEAARRRILMERSRDGIVVLDQQEHKVYEANQAFADLLGYTLEEVRRLYIWEFDDLFSRKQVLEATPSPADFVFETRHRRKDGTVYDAEVSATSAEVGGRRFDFCVVRDISGRKAAETALRESEEKFSKAFQHSPDAVFIVDKTDRLLEVNEGYERFTGYRREEAIGKGALDLNLWADPAERDKAMSHAVAVAGRVRGYLARFRHRNGQEKWGELWSDPIEIRGTPCLLFTLRDVTESRRAEQERRRLEAQIHQAQKLESVGRLAGGVAHDMNNVLSAILGLATAHLQPPPADRSLREALETVASACLRGRSLVRGLLSFARPDLAEERVLDLNAIVLDEVRLLERTTLQRIRLETNLEPAVRPVMGDPAALSHALMNLCVNAIAAMPEGGVLTLQTRNVGSDGVELTVADSGCGMTPDVLQRAMDPFFTTKPQGEGTGLGLSLAYSTVKAHHGQMEIYSRVGEGTRIVMVFPFHTSPAPEAQAASIKLPSVRGLRILVIDDDDLVRAALHALLDGLGHSATIFSSGEAALQALEQGLEIEAVILDMNMPGLDGAGTLRRLRALRPHVPVLLATGRVDERAQELVQSYPGIRIIAKPFSLAELGTQLGDLVSPGPPG